MYLNTTVQITTLRLIGTYALYSTVAIVCGINPRVAAGFYVVVSSAGSCWGGFGAAVWAVRLL